MRRVSEGDAAGDAVRGNEVDEGKGTEVVFQQGDMGCGASCCCCFQLIPLHFGLHDVLLGFHSVGGAGSMKGGKSSD